MSNGRFDDTRSWGRLVRRPVLSTRSTDRRWTYHVDSDGSRHAVLCAADCTRHGRQKCCTAFRFYAMCRRMGQLKGKSWESVVSVSIWNLWGLLVPVITDQFNDPGCIFTFIHQKAGSSNRKAKRQMHDRHDRFAVCDVCMITFERNDLWHRYWTR